MHKFYLLPRALVNPYSTSNKYVSFNSVSYFNYCQIYYHGIHFYEKMKHFKVRVLCYRLSSVTKSIHTLRRRFKISKTFICFKKKMTSIFKLVSQASAILLFPFDQPLIETPRWPHESFIPVHAALWNSRLLDLLDCSTAQQKETPPFGISGGEECVSMAWTNDIKANMGAADGAHGHDENVQFGALYNGHYRVSQKVWSCCTPK